MKVVRLFLLCVLSVLGGSWVLRAEELPPAAKETIEAYEKEAAEVQTKIDAEIRKAGEKAADQLKTIQDRYCQQAKLDEAVAVRDQIRLLKKGGSKQRIADLPPDAVKVMDELDEAQIKPEERLQKIREKADAQLKTLQDKFCKDGKLDEAVAVRDLRRLLQHGVTNAQPDPGLLNAQAEEIGKVWYFEVVGDANQPTWGSDVYTTGSHLGATAVHAGVLANGQKGIVKVTILLGQNEYASTTRNGVTSQPWAIWGVSFKVERLSGLVRAGDKK